MAATPIRFPNEDMVQWRNRLLAEQGRADIEWYWTGDRLMRLRQTGRSQPRLDFGTTDHG